MEFKSSYLQGVYDTVQRRNQGEPEFLQAVKEVLESFEPVLEKRPELEKTALWSRSGLSSSGYPGWMTPVRSR